MVRVARVLPGSIAEELEIAAGTELLSVNGQSVRDFLDWEFLTADESLLLSGRDPDGTELFYEIEREEGKALGIELEPPSIRRCANRCEFCFIEGLPPGLRKSLYVRDDDYRLSFAYGNFATLSNLKEQDYDRIFSYRLSPLYISVHATDLDARRRLLNNHRVPDIRAQLRRLAGGGISFHCQLVIVPELNDGPVLEQSLSDLWELGEAVLTTAVVPVGLTQFSHLYRGRSMDRVTAGLLLDHVEGWGRKGRRERGTSWVFASDELYLLAERPLPDAEHYGDFAQIENGVGAVAYLRQRVSEGLPSLPRLEGLRIGVVTGMSMVGIMPGLLDRIATATGAEMELIPTENSLFGPSTTVSGLLVGADIQRALSGRRELDVALIPAETVNDAGRFLDDLTFEEVASQSPVPTYASYDFLDVLSAARPESMVPERGAA